MAKKKLIMWTTVCAILAILTGSLSGQNKIENFKTSIENGKWEEVAPYFADDSYLTLKKYFSRCISLKIITSESNDLTYKAKFLHKGEMGIISFEEKEGKFFNATLKNQIRPLYFIEKFKKYKANNIIVNIGNAKLHFISGYFYETIPYRSVILFEGKWTFYIKPDDPEEQLTLKRQYKRDYFSTNSKAGIFIINRKGFLKKLPLEGEVTVLSKECHSLYASYREGYGINIKQFNEYWYLPFPEGTNMVIFKKDKKSFYYYMFNNQIVPDTQFSSSEGGNRIILSYNALKGLKFNFGTGEKVNNVNLNIFYSPDSHVISGSATILYENSSTLHALEVAKDLKLRGNLDPDGKGLNIFRKGDRYYLMGTESKKLSLFFNGNIAPNPSDYELFKTKGGKVDTKSAKEIDPLFFLSRTQNFYPNPGSEFFKSDVTVTVPGDLNCLVTGNFVEKKVENMTIFKFQSPSTKGISMALGNFKAAPLLDAKIPIQFYIPRSVEFPDNINLKEIQNAMDFFFQVYGPLDISTLNVLIGGGEKDGGISNSGFVIIYMPYDQLKISNDLSVSLNRRPQSGESKIHSPVLLRDCTEDHIIHEMAHQWWGGVVSWSTYQDVWLTEGLAHFSVLYYLKKNIGDRQYNRIVKKLKRWVSEYSDSGPIIYGNRIPMLEKNGYEAYQSVVYDKSVIVFLMAMDMIGEQEFNRRLISTLHQFKYKSITSMQFIHQFCGDNETLFKFFKNWIYSRSLPTVELVLLKNHSEYDNVEYKKVVLSINQVDTDFVFPLQLAVVTEKGTTIEPIIIKEKQQTVIISRDSRIQTIEIADSITPVKEKK